MMLSKSFGVIYFHFNIFSEKNSKEAGVKIYIFGFLKNLSQTTPKNTTKTTAPESLFNKAARKQKIFYRRLFQEFARTFNGIWFSKKNLVKMYRFL